MQPLLILLPGTKNRKIHVFCIQRTILMKLSNLLALVQLTLITACATSPTPVTEALPTPQERVYYRDADEVPTATAVFVRDSGVLAMWINLHLLINGVKAASIAEGEKVALRLPVGEYVFGVYNTNIYGADVQSTIDQKLDAGQTYLYRVFVSDLIGPKIEIVIEKSVE
jgi:hypothetical protein